MNARIILACGSMMAWTVFAPTADISHGDTNVNTLGIQTRLGVLSGDAREQYLSDLLRERLRLQDELVRLLDGGQSEEIKFCAAYLLGMYRMDGAVKSLARHIRMEQAREIPRDREALWGRYPVVEALVRIGIPSIPVMFEIIEKESDQTTRDLSARVIRDVYGREIGKQVIEKRIKAQTEQSKRQRLRDVLSLPLFAQ